MYWRGTTPVMLVGIVVVTVTSAAALWWAASLSGRELDRNAVPRGAVQDQLAVVRYVYQPARDQAELPAPTDSAARSPGVRSDKAREPENAERGEVAGNGQPAGARAEHAEGEYQAGGHQPYCRNPQSNEDSYLCAQWAAVNEAATGNGIARSGLVFQQIALLGSVLLGALTILGLLVTARAAELAAEAATIASSAGRGRLVACVEVAAREHDPPEFAFALRNVGSTAAIVDCLAWREAGTRTHLRLDDPDPGPDAFHATVGGGALLFIESPRGTGPWFALTVRNRDVFGRRRLRTELFECLGVRGFRCRGQDEADR